MKLFLRQWILKQMKRHKGDFLLNQWCNGSVKNKILWSMLERRHLSKQNLSNLYDGDQSNKRTTNEIQGVNSPITWLIEFTISWMDDNLDALGPPTIQGLKKSSKNKANQQAHNPNQMKLSSKWEHNLSKLRGKN